MLESQKDRIYERSRLRAKGVAEEDIFKKQQRPFRPAFVDGKRKTRDSATPEDVPTAQFAFRSQG